MSLGIDVLVFGSHPDDAELGCGGLLCKMKAEGFTTGIIDMTRGEMGSRGTPELREQEALRAAESLSLDIRENLGMKDGCLEDSIENRHRIVDVIREYRPSFVFTSYPDDGHPDHVVCGRLVRDAFFSARLRKLEGRHPHFAPKRLFFYPSNRFFNAVVCVDVTPFFDKKIEVLSSYKSQFIRDNEPSDAPRPIGVDDHIFHTESRMRHFGSQINVKYAEGFITELPLAVEDVSIFS